MDFLKIAVSVGELAITVLMAVGVVFATYRALIHANTDFDEDAEIIKGNLSVGILVAALLLASANIMHQAFVPVSDTVHLYLSSGLAEDTNRGALALYALGNLVFAFVIVQDAESGGEAQQLVVRQAKLPAPWMPALRQRGR